MQQCKHETLFSKYYDLLTKLPFIELNKNCINDMPFNKWRMKKNRLKNENTTQNVVEMKTVQENSPVGDEIKIMQHVSHNQIEMSEKIDAMNV